MNKTEFKQNWEKVIELLYTELDPVIVSTFFKPLIPTKISESEGKMYFYSENSHLFQNTINHNQETVVKITEKVFGKPYFAVVTESESSLFLK